MTNPIDQETLEDIIVWRRLEDLCADAELACIDGRFDNSIIGAPGGDTGELVALLAAIEEASGEEFSDEEVEQILERQMDRLGRFYLHSDRLALENLEGTLAEQPQLAEALEEAGGVEALVREPAQAAQAARESLARLLVEPEHVGCGHLKLMLLHVDEFGVRKPLVEATIRAFFNLLWEGRAEANFTVLEGVHTEEAVVVFDTDEPLEPSTEVPAVRHSGQVPSLFVNHLPASQFKRARALEALSEVSERGPVDEDQRRALLERAGELAAHYTGVTVSHLAPDLPVYTVNFAGHTIDLKK